MLERLDILLLVLGGVLMIVSFILNIVSSAKLSKLAEGVTQLEAKFESQVQAPAPRENDSRAGHDTGSRGRKLDSSIFPTTEPPADDSHSTRYRPPGSRNKKPGDSGVIESGTVTLPPTRHGIGKAGVRLPANPAVPVPPPATPEKPVSDDEARALLKEYLGRETDASDTGPVKEMADVRDIYDKGNAESEIMDVIDTRVMGPFDNGPAKPHAGAINPFDAKTQHVNFSAVLDVASGLASGASVTVDFTDIPLMVESEIRDLRKLANQLAARGLSIEAINAGEDIRAPLSAIPQLTFSDS